MNDEADASGAAERNSIVPLEPKVIALVVEAFAQVEPMGGEMLDTGVEMQLPTALLEGMFLQPGDHRGASASASASGTMPFGGHQVVDEDVSAASQLEPENKPATQSTSPPASTQARR